MSIRCILPETATLDERLARAKQLLRDMEQENGGTYINWTRISAQVGLTRAKLKRRFVPGFREADNERRKITNKSGHQAEAHPDRNTVSARLAEIPRDTRSLTGRIMGDPLPLDHRRMSR